MHGSVLGVPVSRATGTLLPDLFLAIPSLHLANPRKGSKDKENILRQIEKNRKRKINYKN
jgi:hypothetical protein